MFETGKVRRGAELLDQIRPGWHREINLGNFVMKNDRRCILGQLYDGYHNGYNLIFPEARSSKSASRSAKRHGYDKIWFGTYTELENEWYRVIVLKLENDKHKEEVDE